MLNNEIQDLPLEELFEIAHSIRTDSFRNTVTYSPKVFIPLTKLCRDRCGYCTFAEPPARLESPYMTPEEVLYNAWQIRHVLSTGAHGILHTHARRADAVATFVAASRYVFQKIGRDKGIPEGLRGGGGQKRPAPIWNLDPVDYMWKADPWPLNPDGELMLGLKIEDRFCLPDADNIAAVPGISFAEWGPGDMGMSHGDPDLHDPPYTDEMNRARNIVKSACDKSNLTFLSSWHDPDMTVEERARHALFEIGARIVHVDDESIADTLRKEMGRKMPW